MFPAHSPRIRHKSELTEGKHRTGTREISTDLRPCVRLPCRRSHLITVTSYTCSLTSEAVSKNLDMVSFIEDNGRYVVCLKNITHLLTLILLRDSPPIFLQHNKLLHLYRQSKSLPLYKQEGNWDELTFAKTSGDQRVLSNDSYDF